MPATTATTTTTTLARLALAATIATGLIAGVYYSYACSVMPGLARGDDRTFVLAMQQINVAIQNPVFFLSFLGAPAVTGIAYVLARRQHDTTTRSLLIALALLVFSIITTAAVNIPLNNRLDVATRAPHADFAQIRHQFEHLWIAFNVVRTLAATAAFGFLTKALLDLQ